MATISIADNDARIQHSIGSSGNTAGSTQFTIDYPFFDLDDIDVTITNSSGADTVLTRGTGTNTFSVAGTSVDDGFSGGYIILNTQYTSSTVTITRDIPIARTSDFATSGPFNISSLNTDLDKIYAILQQIETDSARALNMPTTDTLNSITLPSNVSRRGKYLAFNSSTGNAEIGGSVADTGTVATISGNITTVAGISSNVSTVAGISANVTTVAGISGNVTTVAGISSAVSTVAGISSAVSGASANATLAQNYANKTDGAVASSQYSAKAWAIGGTGVTDTAGSGSAKSWAVEADAVDGSEHSAKSYAISGSAISAGSAKQWALGGGSGFTTSTAVSGGLYSAKYWAEQSALSKTEFSNIYQGTHSSDPSGGSVSAGDLYFNSSSNVLKFYTGSAWSTVEATDTSSLASNGFAVAMAIAL
jgi:hypothetical protein